MNISTVSLSKADKEMQKAIDKMGTSKDGNNSDVVLSLPNTLSIGSKQQPAIAENNTIDQDLQPSANKEPDMFFNNQELSIVHSPKKQSESIFDSINDSQTIGSASVSTSNTFLRFKSLKFLYQVCNKKELEDKVLKKTIGNPFKIKFLHDYLVFLLLHRSELMLMSCASESSKWKEEEKKEYNTLRDEICLVHKKIKDHVWVGFRPNLFQDFRGFNYFTRDLLNKLRSIFSQL